ncbi:MAG: hypothetical protein G01um101430_174 [Parcubacteria group bacterium Gr01-1014_30]|nr:MAG: hypothetical protein G01um101430_174 [Parcubacteria group bacterium Gr01-1014_30]
MPNWETPRPIAGGLSTLRETAKKLRRFWPLLAALGAVLVFIGGFLLGGAGKSQLRTQLSNRDALLEGVEADRDALAKQLSAAETKLVALSTLAAPAPSVAAPVVPEAAVVKRGEGIEHVLIRQLAANPKSFGFDGDAADASVVRRWAGVRAHQIAVLAGYVGAKTGNEVRVRRADKAAYVLQVDSGGKLSVAQFEKGDDGNWPSQSPAASSGLVKVAAVDYQSVTFIGGATSAGLQSYEYLFQRA